MEAFTLMFLPTISHKLNSFEVDVCLFLRERFLDCLRDFQNLNIQFNYSQVLFFFLNHVLMAFHFPRPVKLKVLLLLLSFFF